MREQPKINRYLLAGLSFFIPGLGAAINRNYVCAYFLLFAYISSLVAAASTDTIETTTGLRAIIGFLILTQIASIVTSFYLCPPHSHKSRKSAALFIALYFTLIMGAYQHISDRSEYKIYYVDHESMQPTLMPGDLVIAKKYSDNEITNGEIIIFEERNRKNSYLIKRVARKPDLLKNSSADFLYVLGDNPDRSTDSRQFGMIEKNQVRGIAKTVLANLTEKNISLRELEK